MSDRRAEANRAVRTETNQHVCVSVVLSTSRHDGEVASASSEVPRKLLRAPKVTPGSTTSHTSPIKGRQKWLQLLAAGIAAPFLLLWWLAACLLSTLSAFLVIPSIWTSSLLYWACPFGPYIWFQHPPLLRWLKRVSFEAAYHINLMARLLTIPLRPHMPQFYILGFPKCGTTSLASHLRRHPALASVQGLHVHDIMMKESHFFMGVLGRHTACSSYLYRSFFPTILRRWWVELVLGVGKLVCFDACPVYACLPYIARRIQKLTPDAKFIVMVRNPVEAVFSAEMMLRNMGVPLTWSFMQPLSDEERTSLLAGHGTSNAQHLWAKLSSLGADDPLPHDLPKQFYFDQGSYVQSAMYGHMLHSWLAAFPRERFMFVELQDFVINTEAVVREALAFVGADPHRFQFESLPAGMKTGYHGRRMHPTVAQWLQLAFHDSNQELFEIIGKQFDWD